MISIVLYHSNLERTRVDKTLALSDPNKTTIQGTLKEECDLLYPVIMVEFNSVPTYNYMYISAFNRYYFIDKIVCVQNKLYRLHCSVDVLMSWKTNILNLTPYVSRNATLYTANIDDAIYGGKTKPVVTRVAPSTAGAWYGSNTITSSDTHYRYCMQGAFQLRDNRETPPEILKHEYSLPTLTMDGKHFQDICASIEHSTSWFGSKTIQDVLVRSYALPVEPHVSARTVTDIIPPDGGSGFAFLDTPQKMTDQQYTDVTWTFNIPRYVNENAYRNYRPYRTLKLRFLPFGELTLDYGVLNDTTTLYVKARVNCYNGETQLWYGNDSTCKDYLTTAQCGVDLPFTSTNVDITKAGVGVLTTAVGIGTAVATGMTLPALVGSAVATANTIESMLPSVQVKQGTYNVVDSAPSLIIIDVEQVDKAPSLYGKPYNKEKQLSELVGTGFTVCDRAHLENIPATSNEQNTIEQLLTTGVIL